jgi:hypothetical protein
MAVRSALCAGRPLPPMKIPGAHFCYRLSRGQDHSSAEMIRSIEKLIDLIGNQARYLAACSIVPQLTILPRAFKLLDITHKTMSNFYRSLIHNFNRRDHMEAINIHRTIMLKRVIHE